MFWLPPGGTANGVWAGAWAELADLHSDDIAPVLHLLAQADVGGWSPHPAVSGLIPKHRCVIASGWIRCGITAPRTC
jgi:hypothetical protein